LSNAADATALNLMLSIPLTSPPSEGGQERRIQLVVATRSSS
jgi:hypothetical protein